MASITCYDLRFGEWVRMAALAGAKILFVPAAWPHPRLAHWQILNRARAIENQLSSSPSTAAVPVGITASAAIP